MCDLDDSIILSVIIPTCNRLGTLQRAVDSVIAQRIEHSEIIIVDDSTEDLTDEIRNIVIGVGKVTVIRNTGSHSAANARNFGVLAARGRYITFLDDDDIYLPGRLKNMLPAAFNNNYVMISSGRFLEVGDFKVIKSCPRQRFGQISIDDIKYLNDIDIGFIIERKLFLDNGGFNTSFASLEDWDFILRVLSKGDAYKIERFDYAVNIDVDRPRVSNSDAKSYLQLAEMYREQFGEPWYVYMVSHGLSLSGNLSFSFMLASSIRYTTKSPFICYLRQLKNKLLSLTLK